MHPSIGSFGFGTFKDFIFNLNNTLKIKRNKEMTKAVWVLKIKYIHTYIYLYIYKEIDQTI